MEKSIPNFVQACMGNIYAKNQEVSFTFEGAERFQSKIFGLPQKTHFSKIQCNLPI